MFQILYSLGVQKNFAEFFELRYTCAHEVVQNLCNVARSGGVHAVGMSNKECCSDLYVMLIHSPIDGSDVIRSSFLAVESSQIKETRTCAMFSCAKLPLIALV